MQKKYLRPWYVLEIALACSTSIQHTGQTAYPAAGVGGIAYVAFEPASSQPWPWYSISNAVRRAAARPAEGAPTRRAGSDSVERAPPGGGVPASAERLPRRPPGA